MQTIRSGTEVTPFGFQGSYTDSTGYIYLINRYYDPATDQFLSIDPDVAATDQPYVFTNDDPLNAEDPLGDLSPLVRCMAKLSLAAAINLGAQIHSIFGPQYSSEDVRGLMEQIQQEDLDRNKAEGGECDDGPAPPNTGNGPSVVTHLKNGAISFGHTIESWFDAGSRILKPPPLPKWWPRGDPDPIPLG
jgi:RHS repeat-associated protein